MTRFFKSIKFKLTFWYSSILLFFCAIFVFVFNFLISGYFNRQFSNEPFAQVIVERQVPQRLRNLSQENMDLIEDSRNQDLQTIRELSILSFIPLLALSFGGGYLIADRMLRPLKDLNDDIERITADNLLVKIKYEDTGDEISELIENFNNMISRLKSSFDSQKQFVENASHELKTPLSIIKLNLEALYSKKKLSKREKDKYVVNIKKSIDLMNKLMEDLLLLSSVEQNISKSSINLCKVVDSCVEDIGVIAKDKSIKIDYKCGSKVKILGNSTLVERSIMNILENAVRYSPADSEVVVRVKKEDGSGIVSISDSGPGIPIKHKKRIFERFYRVDKSRSKETGGVGLGLSIVKEIVEKHDGSISVKSSKKGSTFVLKFPVIKK
jgi:signal transduction histidine kinase